jgi:hypothetical protein
VENSEDAWENTQEHLIQETQELRRLLARPICHLSTLYETEVPESIGVYILYDHGVPVYVGSARKVENKASGKPSGLRFRIMHNHLGREGSDNFLKYLGEELGVDRKQAAQYVRRNCECQWMEVGTAREALLLEHFVTAVLNPHFNRE